MAHASSEKGLAKAKLARQRAGVRRGPRVTENTAGSWVPGQGHLPHQPPQAPPAPHLSLPDRRKPICLPYFDEELEPGTSLWVIGWGYTQEHGEQDRSPPASLTGGDGAAGLPAGPGLPGDPSEQPRFTQANCRRPCSKRR